MTVIINDFEVVPDAPEQPSAPAKAEQEAPPPQPGLKPLEIEDIIERRLQRRQRLRAH